MPSFSLGPTAHSRSGLPGRRLALSASATPPAMLSPTRPAGRTKKAELCASKFRRSPAPTWRKCGWRTRRRTRAAGQAQHCASTIRGQAPPARSPRQAGSRGTRRLWSRSSPRRAPLPISGIRGYAVSVDGSGEGWPCVARDWCSEPRRTCGAVSDDDTLSLGTLPEGAGIVRAVAVSGSGVPSAEAGSAVVRVDATRPETTLIGAPGGWADGPVRLVAQATDSLSGMTAGGPGDAYTAIAVDHGVPRIEPGDTTAVTVTGEGTHNVAFYARDAAGNVDRPVAPNRGGLDRRKPPTRHLRPAQDPTEPERIEATVVDSLSGADPARGAIAVRIAGTRGRWLPLPTATATGHLVARWDSDSFPAGTYEFRATGYDTAGNATVSERRGNGARMVLVNPLKTPVRLQAGIGGRNRPATTTVPYGRATVYSGRLTAPSGSPPGRLPVQVVESFVAGAASPRRSTRVLTAADGTFSIRLSPAPAAASRRYSPGAGRSPRAGSGKVQISVRAGVRLRASGTTAADRWRARSSSAAGSVIWARPSPPMAGRSSFSSDCRAATGPSSGPCRPTPAAATATPTRSATTTAAASASSSALTQVKAVGLTSRPPPDRSPCGADDAAPRAVLCAPNGGRRTGR